MSDSIDPEGGDLSRMIYFFIPLSEPLGLPNGMQIESVRPTTLSDVAAWDEERGGILKSCGSGGLMG